jgi:hypothetical protein
VASVMIGNGVTSLGTYAFGYCSSLTSVTIPASVTNLASETFYDCTGLTNVTIGNSVTSIGSEAFYYCTNLTSVIIGTGVTSLGTYAFGDCYGLARVYFQGNSPTPTNDTSVFSADNTGIVYYLPGTTGWGTNFDGWPTMLLVSGGAPFSISGGSFKIQTNQFCFTINSISNQDVVVEGCTNLANPVWVPLATNSLTIGTNEFYDPQFTNYPKRFYRLSSQ